MNDVSIRIPFPTKITVNSYWFGPEQHHNREFKRLCVVDLSLSKCPENVYRKFVTSVYVDTNCYYKFIQRII